MIKNLLKKQNLIYIAILLGIAMFTHFGWVFSNSIFTSGDWHFISNEKYSDFTNFSPVWVVDNLGTTSATPHFYLVRFFEGILTQLGVGFAMTEKIFFFLPIILGSSLGTYYFLRRYFIPRFAFIGALVYMFNTPFLFNHAGPLTIAVVYALAPVILGLFTRLVDNPKNYKLALLLGVFLSISIYYELRCTLLVVLTMFLYLLFRFVTEEQTKKRLFNLFKGLSITGLLVIVLNLFWVIPYFFASKDITFSDRLTQGLFTTFSSVSNALTLYHPFWTGERPAKFIIQTIPFYFWLVPIYAFAGVVISKLKHKEIYFWAFISLLGIFLVKQVNEPFIEFYPWIFRNIPGFAAYRESSKFFIFICLGYSVLIPSTVSAVYALVKAKTMNWNKREQQLSVVAANLVYIIPIVLFLSNALPLVNNTFKTMYEVRTMPTDYETLNTFITEQDQYFRTLWFPTSSRWSIQTSKHPALNAISLTKGEWLNEVFNSDVRDITLRDKSTNIFTDSLSDELLDKLAVKYVIIPLRDFENEDDFFSDYGNSRQYYINILEKADHLKKIDIGTLDILVYENAESKGYITTMDSIQEIDSITNLDSYNEITKNILEEDLNFMTSKSNSEYYTDSLKDIFDLTSTLTIANNISFSELNEPKIYKKTSKGNLKYVIKNNTLSISFADKDAVTINGLLLDGVENNIGNFILDPNKNYHLLIDGKIVDIPLVENTRNLGVVDINKIRLFESFKEEDDQSKYLSFEEGLWSNEVENCGEDILNNYKILKLENEDRGKKGKNHIKLSTYSNMICTSSKPLPVDGTTYILSFDFRTVNTQNIGFNLVSNDEVIQSNMLTSSAYSWLQHRSFIEMSDEITDASIQLIGINNYQMKDIADTYYDDVRFTKLTELKLKSLDTTMFEIPIDSNTLEVSLDTPIVESDINLFENGDFNQGLWEEVVSDCNNYDEFPKVYMDLVDTNNSTNVLQLSAQNHAACTTKRDIPVSEGEKYLLKFKYQSPNANFAKYHITYNDPSRTLIENTLPIKGNDWHDHTKVFKVPYGATTVNLTVYAYGQETGRVVMYNNYDDFTISPFRELSSKYFLADSKDFDTAKPREVSYSSVHNAKKYVTVKSASKSFFLSLNESFNSQWKLTLADQSSGNPLDKTTGNFDKYHFLINGTQNAWFVDLEELCIQLEECTKNSDGTYDINFVIEFLPQRWVYIGSMIGIATLVIVIYYLSYVYLFKNKKTLKFTRWQ